VPEDDDTPEPPTGSGAGSPDAFAGADDAVRPAAAAAEPADDDSTVIERGAHLASTRSSALRTRAAVAVGVAVMVAAAGLGMSSALSESGDDTEAAGGGPTTDATPSTEPPTTAAPATTTTLPPTTSTTAPTETTTTLPPTTTTTAPPDPSADGTLELGESGDTVAALQHRLVELGYWLGEPDGTYGQLTRQAVMAFQKVEGLGRDGVAGPVTQQRLAVAGRPAPRGGDGLEIDLARQVLFVVEGGQVKWAINTSTGNGEAYTSSTGGEAIAATPPGHFQIQREIDGLREAPLGTLYRPKYFNGGIAIHGSGSIPAQPASHGCARVTNSAMDMLWANGDAEIGTPVWVY
jgi:peptidoglycan hydrolase-like protein with peptidoglycan-binding domain